MKKENVNSLLNLYKCSHWFILCSVIFFLVTACDTNNVEEDITPEKLPPIELTTAGIKGISANTPFSKTAIQNIFLNFEVVEKKYETDEDPNSVIEVRNDGHTLLSISPNSKNNVGKIAVKSARVVNKFGNPVGTRFSEMITNSSKQNCSPGYENPLGIVVICPIPESESIVYIFDGDWEGAESEMPAHTLTLPPPSVLKTLSLAEIVWKT